MACRRVSLHPRECFLAEVLVLQKSFLNSLKPPKWQMRRLVLHSREEWQTIVVSRLGEHRDVDGLFFAFGVLCSKPLFVFLLFVGFFDSLAFASSLVYSFLFSSAEPWHFTRIKLLLLGVILNQEAHSPRSYSGSQIRSVIADFSQVNGASRCRHGIEHISPPVGGSCHPSHS